MKLRILHGARAPAHDRGAIAIASDHGAWLLVNLSPAVALDLSAQRHPGARTGLPDRPPAGIVLTDAHVDHVAGLLSLRDGPPLDLYATPSVFEDLTASLPILSVLDHYCGVHWHMVPVAGDRCTAEFSVHGVEGLRFSAMAIDAPSPPYSANAEQPLTGDTIALLARDLASGQSLFCAPGLARVDADAFDWMRQADCLLVDGAPPTVVAGASAAGPEWVELLAGLPARHKLVWPGTDGAGRARQASPDWSARGIALAYDGLEIVL